MSKLFKSDEVMLFVDDEREPYSGWKAIRTGQLFVAYMLLWKERVVALSLDHDMGEGEPSGYDNVKWLIQENAWPQLAIWVHSMNPVGAQNMVALLQRYAPEHLQIAHLPYYEGKGIFDGQIS